MGRAKGAALMEAKRVVGHSEVVAKGVAVKVPDEAAAASAESCAIEPGDE